VASSGEHRFDYEKGDMSHVYRHKVVNEVVARVILTIMTDEASARAAPPT
jgi:hypothetical protein